MVQLKYSTIGSDNTLAAVRCQAIIWTDDWFTNENMR